MLFSSLYAMLTLSKTTPPPKLLDFDLPNHDVDGLPVEEGLGGSRGPHLHVVV